MAKKLQNQLISELKKREGKMGKKISFLVVFLFLCLLGGNSFSAEYYVDCNVSDDSGDGSYEAPKKFISSGIQLMESPGDVLIIKEGVYRGANNMISYFSVLPPSGNSAAGYTKIMAEKPGTVVIDGEGINKPGDIRDRDYLHIDGIKFINSSTTIFTVIGLSSDYRHHIKLTRCGFCEAPDSSDSSHRYDSLFFRYVEYSLLEDCYIWGGAKYRYYILDSRYVILRRCVDRPDRVVTSEYNNSGSIRFYNSHHCLAQNCIVIDGDQKDHYFIASTGAFSNPNMWFTDGPDGSDLSHNALIGCIGVNNTGMRIMFHADDAGNGDLIDNSFFWGFYAGIWTRDSNENLEIRNSVIGGVLSGDDALEADFDGIGIVKNTIFINNAKTARKNFDSASTGNNVYYNNTVNFYSTAAASNEIVDTLSPLDSGLKFPCRVEDGSKLMALGVGPRIIKKIGVSGTIYGESGFDSITSENLWPFPYQDIIKDAMKNYNFHGVDGSRGFCADGQTLTGYVWSFLGNVLPAPDPAPSVQIQ